MKTIMKNVFTRKRLSTLFCIIGIGLMGVDLLLTRNVFVHIGELMAASIFCLLFALVLDRTSEKTGGNEMPTGQSPEK